MEAGKSVKSVESVTAVWDVYTGGRAPINASNLVSSSSGDIAMQSINGSYCIRVLFLAPLG